MMSSLVIEVDPPATLFDEPDPEPPLEAVVADAWSGLAAGEVVACLVCGGPLEPRPAAGRAGAGGRCRDCGTQLG